MQITSLDDLRRHHGKPVYFVRQYMVRRPEARSDDSMRSFTRHLTNLGRMFEWRIGAILYGLPADRYCVNYPHVSFNAAICVHGDDAISHNRKIRIVTPETYFFPVGDDDLSGVFDNVEEAKARLALIMLSGEDSQLRIDFISEADAARFCAIDELDNPRGLYGLTKEPRQAGSL